MEALDALFAGAYGPLVIFCLRIVDVSMSTIRILLAVRGYKVVVPIIGFFEVLVWVFAVGNAIRFLDSGWHLLGYAGGFATGNIVGLIIEEKLAIGYATIRVVSTHAGVEMADALRNIGFGVTEFGGQGRDGRVEIVYTVCTRRSVPRVLDEVERWDRHAFITVEEPRDIRWGWMQSSPRNRISPDLGVHQMMKTMSERLKRTGRARPRG
ncbi:MAG TPA: DUF2179 domain-containing protein [Longimicrobiales bacterium]|nr:DUF2179 domain-containing protein [Longimicrobiales bacterium]